MVCGQVPGLTPRSVSGPGRPWPVAGSLGQPVSGLEGQDPWQWHPALTLTEEPCFGFTGLLRAAVCQAWLTLSVPTLHTSHSGMWAVPQGSATESGRPGRAKGLADALHGLEQASVSPHVC